MQSVFVWFHSLAQHTAKLDILHHIQVMLHRTVFSNLTNTPYHSSNLQDPDQLRVVLKLAVRRYDALLHRQSFLYNRQEVQHRQL